MQLVLLLGIDSFAAGCVQMVAAGWFGFRSNYFGSSFAELVESCATQSPESGQLVAVPPQQLTMGVASLAKQRCLVMLATHFPSSSAS